MAILKLKISDALRREALRQDGIHAWNAYQETSLRVTHEEADAWLALLAVGDDQEPTECHV